MSNILKKGLIFFESIKSIFKSCVLPVWIHRYQDTAGVGVNHSGVVSVRKYLTCKQL
jgi:hypothetical protein